ncbi:MAG: hypothetical protein IGS48_08900 [Oscillatoriales cyanobacterium C42_A2020_001]|nr:hypothetical protein [Leptolyngbyaceae cyanobacterium C42_A2020_001]
MNVPISSSILTSETVAPSLGGKPATIVLQPNGVLNQGNREHFQQTLEDALELATESVIVDLIWVNETDADGVTALVAGIEKAASLGKAISFQSMNHATRMAIEAEWDRRRAVQFGSWSDRFEAKLERFLDNLS